MGLMQGVLFPLLLPRYSLDHENSSRGVIYTKRIDAGTSAVFGLTERGGFWLLIHITEAPA